MEHELHDSHPLEPAVSEVHRWCLRDAPNQGE